MRFVYPILFIELFLCCDYTNTLSPPRQIYDIPHTRGKEFRKFWPQVFESEEEKDSDEWWR